RNVGDRAQDFVPIRLNIFLIEVVDESCHPEAEVPLLRKGVRQPQRSFVDPHDQDVAIVEATAPRRLLEVPERQLLQQQEKVEQPQEQAEEGAAEVFGLDEEDGRSQEQPPQADRLGEEEREVQEASGS